MGTEIGGEKMKKEEAEKLREELEAPHRYPIVMLDDDNQQYPKLWDWLLKGSQNENSSNLG